MKNLFDFYEKFCYNIYVINNSFFYLSFKSDNWRTTWVHGTG